ncbi:MAG: hypothetical protein IKZ19_01180 [Clostridia bacterium]|nr:hypothetical protein [Clostridia bacterium]
MKRTLTALFLIAAALFCTACGSEPQTEESRETTVPATEATSPSAESAPQTLSPAESTLTSSAETSAAAASATEAPPAGTESSVPETEAATESPVPATFVFDPYTISPEYAALYGADFIDVYRGLADAFINYETTCFCPDEATFSVIFSCVDSCMPYFASDAVLTYDSFDEEAKTVTIHYLSDSKEAHDAAYANFISAVSAYISGNICEGDSDLIKAISVYRAFSSVISYDMGVMDVSAHGALVNREGIAHGFAGAYAYLLRQVGIPAHTVGGLSTDGSAAHEWVALCLDGKWYYADPTYENGETGGFGLSYFGTTNDERREAGYDPANCAVGTTGSVRASSLGADSNDFEVFRGSTDFDIFRAENELLLSNSLRTDASLLPGGAK